MCIRRDHKSGWEEKGEGRERVRKGRGEIGKVDGKRKWTKFVNVL